MQFVTIFCVCCVSSNKLLNIAASLHKSVICHCLIGADLNIHVEFKHLFVPKRTVSASFEKNCQRTVRSSWVDRPPFKMFGHPNICLIISKIVSYIFYLLHSSNNVEIHFVIGYCAAGNKCSMITL